MRETLKKSIIIKNNILFLKKNQYVTTNDNDYMPIIGYYIGKEDR